MEQKLITLEQRIAKLESEVQKLQPVDAKKIVRVISDRLEQDIQSTKEINLNQIDSGIVNLKNPIQFGP